ncbi:MAG: NAD-dependent epimerase/dehydratase family protein [Rhodospirillales bacterium]|nr:NAD-dependent epimerase/dehydratase family protein [Rhodospirillales bacterium]
MIARRVTVLGATGFVGRNIAERLAALSDFEVTGVWHRRPPFDRPTIRWRQADLTDAAQVHSCLRGSEIVIQAAATTSGAKDILARPHIHVTDNAVMNSLVLRAAHDQKAQHILFLSCSIMYPSTDRPLAETDFNGGQSIHPRYFGAAWTKLYVEKMCEFYAGLGTTRFTVIRHSNVFGPYDKFDLERSHVLGATITKAMTATDGTLAMWGDGREKRDFLFTSDLTDFMMAAIAQAPSKFALYNVGGGHAISIRDLAQLIVATSGRQLATTFDTSKPTIPIDIVLDCGKAKTELGWEPKVTLEDGLKQTITWWRNHIGSPPAKTPHK